MNLSKLKELEAKATPGDWIELDIGHGYDMDHLIQVSSTANKCSYDIYEFSDFGDSDEEFVCKLRNSAKEMISTIERYKAALEKIATEADKCGKLMEDNQPSQGDLRDMALEALKDPAPR